MTTDNITLHQTAIAEITSAITSLKTTWATAPEKLESAQLPALFTFTGASEEIDDESDIVEITREYRVQVAVLSTAQGNPAKREEYCRPILEAVKAELRKYPSLDGVVGVQNSRVMRDSGIVILPEWGYKYIGFEIPLRVTYHIKREYAQGE